MNQSMNKKKNVTPQYRQGWLTHEDLTLAKVAVNVIRKGGSKAEACRAAARELGRSVEGTKTRWRALNELAGYYRHYSITDNGVRVQGLTVKQEKVADRIVGFYSAGGKVTGMTKGFDLTPVLHESSVTITVGRSTISGSPADLRKILGI